jgi:hypothetical protein
LLKFPLGNVPISCFDWASHERIVVGCATGHVAVFDIGASLRNGNTSGASCLLSVTNCIPFDCLLTILVVEPTAFFLVHGVNVTSIAALRQPLLKPDGQPDMSAESARIATTSLDGSCRMVDLRDVANVFNFGHERGQ